MDLSGSWDYIEQIARSRLSHNKTRRHVSIFGEGIETLGVAGEIVVRRFLGLPEAVHEGFDHGVDIECLGMRMDVKATVLTSNAGYRFLQWPYWKTPRADYIVSAAIDPVHQSGTVIGYATRGEIEVAPVNPTRAIPCREIAFTDLHHAWELAVEICRRRSHLSDGRFPAPESDRAWKKSAA